MPDLKKEGHRERMRTSYLSGAYEHLPDYNLLELFLSLIIPQKEVKPLSYELINKYKTVDGVIHADPKDLMKIKGIGECTAVAIKLVADLNKRALLNRNQNVVALNTITQADEYCMNLLGAERVEKIAMVTLRSDKALINVHTLSIGTINSSAVNIRKIVGIAIEDGASAVIITHNHPDGDAYPSINDINFTIELNAVLKKVKIVLLEHIIVGKDCFNITRDHPSFSVDENKT